MVEAGLSQPPRIEPRSSEAGPIGNDLSALAHFIHSVSGIHLPQAKYTMLETRMRRRLRALALADLDGYLALLADPVQRALEVPRLMEVVTTNKTAFFREPAHFEFLVGPGLDLLKLSQTASVRRLRVWSSACSTGQEAYTLAMVLAEIPRHRLPNGFQIVASDISEAVLQTARQAIYPDSVLDEVPQPYRSRYLLRSKDRSLGMVRIAPDLRRSVEVRNINLNSSDARFDEPMDVIFCRNILIYFDHTKKLEVLRRLMNSLRVGGILCLGHADSIGTMGLPLRSLIPSVYQRI